MSFIVRNTAFDCLFCGEHNPPADQTCRNHCRKCLSALHLDDKFPGDRSSQCEGEMKVVDITVHPKHDFVLHHQCQKCGKKIQNKSATDDSREAVFFFLQKKSEDEVLGR